MPVRTAALLVLLVMVYRCPAADDLPARFDHAPNKSYSPEEARAKMTVPPGFHVDLVASEPEIVNPIAMTFDDRGRIWVTQSVEYPRKSAGVGRDTIKIIDGVDASGRATRIATFVDDLNVPTGIAFGYGGVWVLNSPDLLFYREKDGKVFSKEVVITGFGRTDFHELPSSLTWGPDGWLYGLNGVFNQSHVVDKHGKTHDFTAAMWRIHPRTREFQVFAQGTSNPYGIIWDAEGSAIVEVCHWATDHLFHFVETGYYLQQAGIYPPFTIKLGSITDHGHQKTAYCGIARLSTDQFPPEYRERVCVGNLHGDCINVDHLQRDGSTYLSKAEPDLLTSHDDWFMPVSLKIGPDGCLYILDWYDRYHCSQDAIRDPAGVDRLKGRIYRVRYGESPSQTRFDLERENDLGLMSRLHSPNIYFREAAQRLLTERLSDPAGGHETVKPFLEKLATEEDADRTARLHALWALIGSGALDSSLHEKLLNHSDPAVRAWAVRAAGNQHSADNPVRDHIEKLAADKSPDVQLQVAIAAPKIDGFDALPTLHHVLQNCGNDKLIPSIVWANSHPLLETQSARYLTLLSDDPAPPSPGTTMLLPHMAGRILASKIPNLESVERLLDYAFRCKAPTTAQAIAAVASSIDNLPPAAREDLANRLRPLIDRVLARKQSTPVELSMQLLAARLKLGSFDSAEVRRKFLSSTEDQSSRLQALDALIAFKDQPLLGALPDVITSASPEFATKIFAALGRVENPKLADVLLALYPKLDPKLQPLAIDLIMQREPWAAKLLNAVLNGKLPKSVLNANDLRKIMDSDDREAIWAVEKAYGQIREERNPEREKVVAEMGDYLRKYIGNPFVGQRVFETLCAQCHTIYGKGAKIGPDITANGRSNFDQLLSNVFDPSLVIGPGYQVVTVVTRDGRNLTGLLAEDNEQRVVVRIPGGSEEAVPRSDVKYTHPSKLSMMPEGIENLLSRKDLCDLFAFLSLDKPPTDPSARPIAGAPSIITSPQPQSDARIRLDRTDRALTVRSRLPGNGQWIELATYVTDPSMRPYLHPVRGPAGRVILTEDKPADHPWQHGIFTGFHQVNGVNYWKEDQGHQHFVRMLDVKEGPDRVSWRALVNLVDPKGFTVLEEEDSITVHAPESADACAIDFGISLRAKEKDVHFGKYFVGGLSVRMPWDSKNPRQTHLNSEGLTGRACEQKRAAWCTVERPFGEDIFGVAVFDHPSNPTFPSVWRADEQGLINPNVSGLADWDLKANESKDFRYQVLIYQGPAARDRLAARARDFEGR